MAENSKIEWTDASWNPVRGCTKVSPGCAHCYAETFAERWRGIPGHAYEHGFDLRLAPNKLDEPRKWKKPKRIFVNSMSDLFHKDVPDEYIEQVVRVMVETDRHTYQVLTKRSERLRDLLQTKLRDAAALPHIWWGVSVENKKHGVPRIGHLCDAGARVAFLSIEPLLEDVGTISLYGVHWVIVGGESGPGARPMHPDWARSIRDQCVSAGVPYFFKQWGEWIPAPAVDPHVACSPEFSYPDGQRMFRVGKKAAGRVLDGHTWDEFPRREE